MKQLSNELGLFGDLVDVSGGLIVLLGGGEEGHTA